MMEVAGFIVAHRIDAPAKWARGTSGIHAFWTVPAQPVFLRLNGCPTSPFQHSPPWYASRMSGDQRVPTARQALGVFGEQRVTKDCICPRGKRSKTLVRLPPNFKCADVICDFCGYLAQVKAMTSSVFETFPNSVLGAAWAPQKERMDAGICFPLFLVLVAPDQKRYSIFYLSADLQRPEMFEARQPLSSNARRAGLARLSVQP